MPLQERIHLREHIFLHTLSHKCELVPRAHDGFTWASTLLLLSV
jgi:hypothetical protein